MKKTTVEISDDLMEAARKIIARDKITFRQLVEQGIRIAIEQRAARSKHTYKPVTFQGDGLTDEFQDQAWETVAGAKIHDARIAALCLHHSVTELWTVDRDFSRYPGLRVRNPLGD